MCKVSVICPVRNGSDFIYRHYSSLVKYLEYDFEVVYVDNNSTDNTREVIQELISLDKRVKYIYEPVSGVSRARNAALLSVNSKVLCFLDVDDLLISSVVNDQISLALKNKQSSVCYAEIKKSNGVNESIRPFWRGLSFNFMLNFGVQVPFSTFVTPNINVVFCEDMKTSEDWLYMITVREALRKSIFVFPHIGRCYHSETGYSNLLPNDEVFYTHCDAFSRHYRVDASVSEEVLKAFYNNRLTIFQLFSLLGFSRIKGLLSKQALKRLI